MTTPIQIITETVAVGTFSGIETLLEILLRITTNHNETMASDEEESNPSR